MDSFLPVHHRLDRVTPNIVPSEDSASLPKGCKTLRTLHKSFFTNPDHWLGHSGYFEALFSGKWGDERRDGSYFIEADSVLFEHILGYLRTGVLPVFYDTTKGHDFTLYQKLFGEAQYFAIERLCKWLKNKTYLKAVTVRHTALEPADTIGRTFGSEVEVTVIPVKIQESQWYCPTSEHQKERGCYGDIKWEISSGWRYQERSKWAVTQKEVVFDHDLCVNAYLEEDSK